ncbi:hypothetical protein TNIN_149041 [Trichonephila inaurata madagascariensis]|uniref:Uncharacterized protein n=1 Tax=Trichonephila inaurata madagascariensis TaxID=2747483 RepID=A0A8X6Y253_9ARAC|nr:hypothetical protein TNIN_149041 [Trichonephila inaurata madagascariensis]
MESADNSQQIIPPAETEVPEATKKPRIAPFIVSPKGDWRQLVALAKLVAPSFQSQMSGRFLKVTVAYEVEHRALSRWLEKLGAEHKLLRNSGGRSPLTGERTAPLTAIGWLDQPLQKAGMENKVERSV